MTILILVMLTLSTRITTTAFVLRLVAPTRSRTTICSMSKKDVFSDRPIYDENSNNDNDANDEEYVADDCGDEGCDLDWDEMPSWDEDDEVEAVYYNDNDEEFQEAWRKVSSSSSSPDSSKGPSVEQRRLHMEMQWQLEEATQECAVEKPETCGSQKCNDCHGRGWNDCRFCHGTAVLKLDKTWEQQQQETSVASNTLTTSSSTSRTATAAHASANKKFILPSSFSACKICTQGVEMCRTCQGSGWIAGWTQIPNQRNDNDQDPLLP